MNCFRGLVCWLMWRFVRPNFGFATSVIVAILLCFVAAAGIAAAPVTFRFEAQVASVLPNRGGASLPFDVSPGDDLKVNFTFQPAVGGPTYPQVGTLEFALGGETLEISGFNVVVRNNDGPNAVPIMGSMADPANAPIDDQAPGTSDNISLTCLSQAGFNCGKVPLHNELVYHPSIFFAGTTEILTSENLIDSVVAWNMFAFREMSLSFVNTSTGGETYIGAFVGAVSEIPEPNFAPTVIIGAIWFLVFSARCQIRNHERWIGNRVDQH